MLRDAIREAFKVPKITLSDTDNVNFSNAETRYNVFSHDVVDYSLGKFARTLTRQLATEFSANYLIEHESFFRKAEEKIKERLKELK